MTIDTRDPRTSALIALTSALATAALILLLN